MHSQTIHSQPTEVDRIQLTELRTCPQSLHDGIGLRQPGGWLELKDGKLSGKFIRVDFGGEITVNATVADGAITGTAQLGVKSGNLTCRLVNEADLAAINAWPRTSRGLQPKARRPAVVRRSGPASPPSTTSAACARSQKPIGKPRWAAPPPANITRFSIH